MKLPGITIAMVLLPLAACGERPPNPCIDEYPASLGHVLKSNGGRVARIEPVAWFEEGVYRVVVESGGEFMTRPGKLPMPAVGSDLDFIIYSKDASSEPTAGCYCQRGTSVCVEEYSSR